MLRQEEIVPGALQEGGTGVGPLDQMLARFLAGHQYQELAHGPVVLMRQVHAETVPKIGAGQVDMQRIHGMEKSLRFSHIGHRISTVGPPHS